MIAYFEHNVLDACTRKNGQGALAAIKAAFKKTASTLVRVGYQRAIEFVGKIDKRSADLLKKQDLMY